VQIASSSALFKRAPESVSKVSGLEKAQSLVLKKRVPSTTVLQEATSAAGTAWQGTGQVGCELAAQGGDGMWVMPFGSHRQPRGA